MVTYPCLICREEVQYVANAQCRCSAIMNYRISLSAQFPFKVKSKPYYYYTSVGMYYTARMLFKGSLPKHTIFLHENLLEEFNPSLALPTKPCHDFCGGRGSQNL